MCDHASCSCWPLPSLLPPRLCNGLSGPSRPPGACVPLLRVRTRIPLLYSWGGCDSPRGQRSLRGQDCQDLPRGEHDGHHAWLPGGGQRQSGPGPGPGARRSESASATTEPGLLRCTSTRVGVGGGGWVSSFHFNASLVLFNNFILLFSTKVDGLLK